MYVSFRDCNPNKAATKCHKANRQTLRPKVEVMLLAGVAAASRGSKPAGWFGGFWVVSDFGWHLEHAKAVQLFNMYTPRNLTAHP